MKSRNPRKKKKKYKNDWDLLTFLIQPVSFFEKRNGNFNIIFKCKCTEWLFNWCRCGENSFIGYYVTVNHFFIDHIRTWMRLYTKKKMKNE